MNTDKVMEQVTDEFKVAATVPDEVADKVKVIFLDVFDIIKYCKNICWHPNFSSLQKVWTNSKPTQSFLCPKWGNLTMGQIATKNL